MSMNKCDVARKVHEEHCCVLVTVAFNGAQPNVALSIVGLLCR